MYSSPLRSNFWPDVLTKPVTVGVEAGAVVDETTVVVVEAMVDVVVAELATPGRHSIKIELVCYYCPILGETGLKKIIRE